MKHFGISSYSGFRSVEGSYFPTAITKCSCEDDLVILNQLEWFDNKNFLFICSESKQILPENLRGLNVLTLSDLEVTWAGSDNLRHLVSNTDSVLITRCFLESVPDPRPVLRALRASSLMRPITLQIAGLESSCHFRTWTTKGLQDFLVDTGATIVQNQYALSSLFTFRYNLPSDKSINGLSPAQVDFALLITEDARVEATGGIGTYTAMVSQRILNTAFLYVAPNRTPKALNVISSYDCLGDADPDQLFEGSGQVEALKVLLTLFPLIQGVEIPDYRSLGYRIVQAREVGHLPTQLKIRIFLHGNIDYLKYQEASDTSLYSDHELKLQVRDAKAFASADQVVSPTNFLSNLMTNEFGYSLASLKHSRLPFALESIPETRTQFMAPTRLVFVGKFTKAKGWNDFVASLKLASYPGITEIVAFSPGAPTNDDVKFLESKWNFTFEHLPHDQLLDKVLRFQHNSIFVLPYLADNHPFAVLEQVLLGSRFLIYNSGGGPELLPASTHSDLFVTDNNPTALAQGIKRWLSTDPELSTNITNEFSSLGRATQAEINQDFAAEFKKMPHPEISKSISVKANVDVITPFFNTDLQYVKRLSISLINQSKLPHTWIVVDDGSTEENHSALSKWLKSQKWPFQVEVIHQVNTGLAGARNAGLKHSRSDFVLFVDSDDVLAYSAIAEGALALRLQTSALAVSGFGLYFDKDTTLEKSIHTSRLGVYHKPLGTELARSIGLKRNEFMSSCAMFRRQRFSDIGGWGPNSKATWEDWATYLRLTWANEKIAFIPGTFFGYRVLENSMSRTYSRYFGLRRLHDSVPGMTKLDLSPLINVAPSMKDQISVGSDTALLIDLLTQSRLRVLTRLTAWARIKLPSWLKASLNRILRI